MAQTLTVVQGPEAGGMAGKPLKLIVINVANGAAETSRTIDYATYGLGVVLLAGHQIMDVYSSAAQYDPITGTSVAHTWTAADVAAARCWAIGY